VAPTDLDACGAHYGITPDSNGVLIYHHHVQDKAPFAVGCYGPNADLSVVSVAQCRSFYRLVLRSSLLGDYWWITVDVVYGVRRGYSY